MKQPNIKIDPEFERLIPKLSKQEYDILYEDIRVRGIRDNLVVWAETDILLDGHNRWNIAKELDCNLKYEYIGFPSRTEAKIWIINNQLGRRNLTKAAKYKYVNEVLKPLLSEQAEVRRLANLKQNETTDVPILGHREGRVEREIAAAAGVSHGFAHQVETILKEGTPDQIETIMTQEGTVNKTYNETKKQMPKAKDPEPPACNICGDMACHPLQIKWNGINSKGHICDSCAMQEPMSKIHGLLKHSK